MNCKDCKYRKDVPGSAHSECVHPITQIHELKEIYLLQVLSGSLPENPSRIISTNNETQEKNLL